MNHTKSLEIWSKYGEYVLMATEYQDTVIAEGQGCVIKDIDGNEFLDMSSGQICAILGHNHPELIRKINEQMKHILHTGTAFLSPSVFEASARIAEVAPGNLKKSIFLSTGAEANECAFRLAKAYTEKNGIVAFTKVLALEVAEYNVNVNAIAPGFIGTEAALSLSPQDHIERMEKQIPFGRFGRPEDLLGAVLLLVSDEGSYITGETILVSGGLTMR